MKELHQKEKQNSEAITKPAHTPGLPKDNHGAHTKHEKNESTKNPSRETKAPSEINEKKIKKTDRKKGWDNSMLFL